MDGGGNKEEGEESFLTLIFIHGELWKAGSERRFLSSGDFTFTLNRPSSFAFLCPYFREYFNRLNE